MKHALSLAFALAAVACGRQSGQCATAQAAGGLSESSSRNTGRLVVTHADGRATMCAAFLEDAPGAGLRVRTAAHCVNPLTARSAVVRPDWSLEEEWAVDSPSLRLARAVAGAPVSLASKTWGLRKLGGKGEGISAGKDGLGEVVATYGEMALLEGPAREVSSGSDPFPLWTMALAAHAEADARANLAGLGKGLRGCSAEAWCSDREALLRAVSAAATEEERSALDSPDAEEAAKATLEARRDAWESVREELEANRREVAVLAFDRDRMRPGVFGLYPLVHFEVRDQGLRWMQSRFSALRLGAGDSGSAVTFRGWPILVVSSAASDAVSGGAALINLPVRKKEPASGNTLGTGREHPGNRSRASEPSPTRTPIPTEVSCR